MKKVTVLFLVLAALVFACRKNTDEITQYEKGPIPSQQVESSLVGKVTDENGRVVADAAVTVAGQSVKTNADGIFIVRKKLLDNNGTLIRVEKSGYFEAVRFAFPHLNSTTYVEVTLIPKTLSATFDATAGGIISIGADGKVVIPASAIAKADGTPYQGSVRAYAVWLDPSRSDTYRKMPGDLRAIDADGIARMLKTYGMIGVELESPAGEALNLAPGQTAKISMSVPTGMRSSAPTTIPLWHFNLSNGYWEEEGSATLVNGVYEGAVSHFSFWNCDVPAKYLKLSLQLVAPNGDPVQGMQVVLQTDNFGGGSGFTDENGKVSGLVPADVNFLMKLIEPCSTVVKQIPIGPFSTDTDLGKITVDNVDLITVTGVLQNCDNAPVTNGLITFQQPQRFSKLYILPDVDGNFSISTIGCAGTTLAQLTGYDLDKNTQSPTQEVSLTSGTTNIGILKACQTLDQYVTVTCDGITQTYFTFPSAYTNPNGSGYLYVQGVPDPNRPGIDSVGISIYYRNLNAAQTQAELSNIYFVVYRNNVYSSYGCNYCQDPICPCAPVDADPVVFTQYPNVVGAYMEGSVTGKMRKQDQTGALTGPLLPFTLNFRLKRTK